MMTRIGNITSYSGYRTFMDLIKERDIRLSNSYYQLKNNELKNKLRHQQRRSFNWKLKIPHAVKSQTNMTVTTKATVITAH